MTQAEKEIIETFCQELALALRRITGKSIDIHPDMLAVPLANNQHQPDECQTLPDQANEAAKK